MIIPSKQLVIITASQRKQLYLFDPKTACVLHTYSSQSALSPIIAYFQPAQQFLIPHLNNTYINVWDTDAQEPKKFSVGEGEKATSLLIIEGNVLYMGSSQGVLYTFQLPSGILIKKSHLHSLSSQIKNIIFMKQFGYLITGTKKEVKLWTLRNLISQQQKPVSQKTIHSVSQIINMHLVRGILCIVSQKSLQFYYANNLSLFHLGRDLPKFTNITCSCSSQGSIFIGDTQGQIKQIPIDAHQKQLQFQQRKGQIQLIFKKGLQIDTKIPLSALAYVPSTDLLVSGNLKGQIKIWQNNLLKNSVQLFKTSISLIFTLPRPNKQMKIPQSLKIKSFHKQQLTKLEQPIHFDSKDSPGTHFDPRSEPSSDFYLQKMLNYLTDPSDQLQSQLNSMKQQNAQLLQANLHYFTILEQLNGKQQKLYEYK